MKIFRSELQVRGYELDAYGHVNNAVYLNYAEYARWCMIEEVTGGQDYFQKNACAPVVARVEIDYKKPCYLGDRLQIETKLLELRKRVGVFQHVILRGNQTVTEMRVTFVVVGTGGRAIAFPSDFGSLFGDMGGDKCGPKQ